MNGFPNGFNGFQNGFNGFQNGFNGFQNGSTRTRSLFRSNSSDVIFERGFRPSDRHDPAKKEFLKTLATQMWSGPLVSVS
jgi:hypothetical protein